MNIMPIKNKIILLILFFLCITDYSFCASEEDYVKAGLNYFIKKEYNQAIVELKKVPNTDPNIVISLITIGLAYKEIDSYEEAIEAFKKAKAHKPKPEILVLACRYLGDAYKHKGLFKEAIEEYKQAIQIEPAVETYLLLGETYSEIGLEDKAINAYKRVIEIAPQNLAAYFKLGLSYTKIQRHNDAIESYRKAIEINPDFSEAYFNMAILYEQIGQVEAASKELEELVRLNPDNAEYNSKLGTLFLYTMNWDKVIQIHKKLLKLNPAYADNFTNMIYYARLAERKGFQATFEYFREGGRFGFSTLFSFPKDRYFSLPKNAQEKINNDVVLIQKYEKAGNLPAAIDGLNKLLTYQKTGFAYYWLASLFFRQAEYEQAIEYLNQAKPLSGYDSMVYLLQARCYRLLNNYHKELEILDAALVKNPDDPFILWALGDSYMNSRDFDKSKAMNDKLKAVDKVIYAIAVQEYDSSKKD